MDALIGDGAPSSFRQWRNALSLRTAPQYQGTADTKKGVVEAVL
jgi:hypothetical protein